VDTYRRGQVEWAAWSNFALNTPIASTEIPRPFLTRIKHFFDLDRAREPAKSDQAGARYAFFGDDQPGKGQDTSFTLLDAACLVLALYLSDLGFKQLETICVLRHIRKHIARELTAAQRSKKRHRVLEGDDPLLLLLGRVEITSPYASVKAQDGRPMVYGPIFVRGYKELQGEFCVKVAQLRKVAVIDFGQLLTDLPEALAVAPIPKRGRT
jgi:hypothetical protein